MRLSIAVGCSLFFALMPARAEALRVGVLPYLSPRTLLLEFAPLRDFVEGEFGKRVELHTAADFPSFLRRTAAGDFDVVLTAPPFARLAQQRFGFRPVIAVRADFYGLVLVPRDSPARTLGDLRGKILHMPHRISFVSMKIEEFLRQRGLVPGSDVTLVYYSTDNNAVLASEKSRDEAAAATRVVFERMPKEITDRLRVLGSTQSAISLVVMAHPRLDADDLARLDLSLRKFPYSVAGLKFFAASHSSFVPVDAAAMAGFDGYVAQLESRPAGGP